MANIDPSRISRYVDTLWDDSIMPSLTEYIRIPNKSPAFDPRWEENGYMEDAIQLLSQWISKQNITGLTQEIIRLDGRTPLLLCEITGSAPGNVLLYGHYDKHPEFTGWNDGLAPWDPVLQNGRLYGRGGADDGYALFSSLAAVGALQDQGIGHPRCLILIEGCEESGSFDLPYYMDHLVKRIETPDLVICLDAECGNYDQMWLTTSLRGMLPGTLSVKVLNEGVHSGAAGGIVPSSFRVLRQLIDRVEDAGTGSVPEILSCPIPDWVNQQSSEVAKVLGDSVYQRFSWSGKTEPISSDIKELIINNTWRTSLATVGISGVPDIANAGNTLRPETSAKLVFRLPPTLDAENAAQQIKTILESEPPYGASVDFELEHPQTGWSAPQPAKWLTDSLNSASKTFFGAPLMAMGTGGTIPFMKMLGDRFPECQFVVTGVLGPHSNAHGPNEFLHILTGKRLTSCTAAILAAKAQS